MAAASWSPVRGRVYVASRSQEREKRSENSRDVVWTREKETEKEESWRKRNGKRTKEKESKSDAEIDEKKGEGGDREGRDE